MQLKKWSGVGKAGDVPERMCIRKMRDGTVRLIACMSTPGGLTGAPRRLLTLAGVLDQQGIRVCVATQADSDLSKAAAGAGHKTVAANARGVLAQRHGALFGGGWLFRLRVLSALVLQSGRFWRMVRQERGDVIWTRGSKGIAFAAPGTLLSRRPLVWDVDYELPSRGAVRWLHCLGLWAANLVVFQYRAAPDAIFGPELAGKYRHKFQTIIPGIDLQSLELFQGMRGARDRREGGPFVILQVGTICDRKNQQLLIDAVARLRHARPNARLLVQLAGGVFENDYMQALEEIINAAGLKDVVEFLGWRTDIHELMADADLLAMPSRDEGVPNTVQEAMAIGLPVIVSDAGGMPEIVSHKKTGWVLPLDDPDAWARQINNCRWQPALCRDVGVAAAKYAAEHFGTESWGREYAAVIKNVVRGNRDR